MGRGSAAYIENMDKYDIIIIGHPYWWGPAFMPAVPFPGGCVFSARAVTFICPAIFSKVRFGARHLHSKRCGKVWE